MATFGRLHKAAAIVPLTILSAAWTASLATSPVTVGAGAAVPAPPEPGVLADGTTIPTEAVEAPASVGEPPVRQVSVPEVEATGIPTLALAAYQRAGAVINLADKSCSIPWELIAAIGRVESDHGRYAGNELDQGGVARPGIYGIALDGTNSTQRILDTDAGAYDQDTEFDRAVGPMQFIPSTWAIVGVDGDNDGTRNPQDIDDAALAAAVYLCSGDDDLSSAQGQRASVYRYNHSNDYVDNVLGIMQAYTSGDFGTVMGPIAPTLPTWTPEPPTSGDKGKKGRGKKGDKGGKGAGNGGTSTSAPAPTATPTPTATAPSPTSSPKPTVPSSPLPTKLPTELPTIQDPVETTLTYLEAQEQCLASGISALQVAQLTACIDNLLNP